MCLSTSSRSTRPVRSRSLAVQAKCSDASLCLPEPFHERVNWEEWGLYDYLQVVKVPMDLGTIRGKLSRNEYKKPVDFAKDMRLVWDNCKLYNQVERLSVSMDFAETD